MPIALKYSASWMARSYPMGTKSFLNMGLSLSTIFANWARTPYPWDGMIDVLFFN